MVSADGSEMETSQAGRIHSGTSARTSGVQLMKILVLTIGIGLVAFLLGIFAAHIFYKYCAGPIYRTKRR